MTNNEMRRKLLNECHRIRADWKSRIDALYADDCLDDDELEDKRSAIQAWYDAEYNPRFWRAFALQFPCRTGWFANTFVASFGTCENKRLSVKQTEVFSRYCVQDDSTWKTGKTYCRVGDKLVTLCRPKYARGYGYVTIREL